jgi:hypothetical protein
MIGTYSTFPEVNWAVIAERSLDQARADAGVNELNRQALAFVSVVVLATILLGYFFAVAISHAGRGHRRKRSLHSRSLRPRCEILHGHRP